MRLNSKDLSICAVLICGAALVVLNPTVAGFFVDPVRVQYNLPLLFSLDASLGIVVFTSILYLTTGRKGWSRTRNSGDWW